MKNKTENPNQIEYRVSLTVPKVILYDDGRVEIANETKDCSWEVYTDGKWRELK